MRLSLVALVLTLAACSGPSKTTAVAPVGPPLNIQSPPSGTLSDAQLDQVAADIRRLEASPLAPDAGAARQALLTWLSGSPDVTVRLCADLVGPLAEADSETLVGYTVLFAAASAGAIIESPRLGDDPGAVSLAAMERLLASYAVARASGAPAVRFLDRMQERQEAGTLGPYLREQTEGC